MATYRQRGNSHQFAIRRRKLWGNKALYLTFDTKEEGYSYCEKLEKTLDMGIVPDWVKQKMMAIVDHGAKTEKISVMMREYFSSCVMSEDDEEILTRILPMIGSLRLDNITYPWVESWIKTMKREQHLAPGTIRHYVGAVARMVDWVVRQEKMAANPLRVLPRGYSQYNKEDAKHVTPKKDQQKFVRLSEDGKEELNIRLVLQGKLKPEGKQRYLDLHHREPMVVMFDLALELAMRLSEIYTLDVYQVDFERHTIFLDKTKNGDKRQVPMTSVIEPILQDYINSQGLKGDDPIFPWFGENKRDRKKTTSRLSRMWGRVFDHAGCPDFTFHGTRHESISRYYERTELPENAIMDIVGHITKEAHKIYKNLRTSPYVGKTW